MMHSGNTIALVIFVIFLVAVVIWAVAEKILEVKRLQALADEHQARHTHDAQRRCERQVAKAAAAEFDSMESAARAARLVN